MRRIKQSIADFFYKVGTFLVEEVSTLQYIVFFAAVIIVFGLFYTYLTPIDHGIGQTLDLSPNITFLTGIYFSIVTISSLGYGDMHPVGFSKILACIEVLLGLSVIGIMIAKVTSRRLSYHVERLFSSDAQKRLEGIAAKFDTSQSKLSSIMPELESAYQSVPGVSDQSHIPTEAKKSLVLKFRNVVSELHSSCAELRDYFFFETEQGNYFQVVPNDAVVRVGNAVDGTFWRFSQLIISLSPQAKAEILDSYNRQEISALINFQKEVCGRVKEYATDTNILAVFQSIDEICHRVSENYFAVPEESRPDQILQGTDEPQGLSGADNE